MTDLKRRQKTKFSLLTITVLIVACSTEPHRFTIKEVERAIRVGEVDKKIAAQPYGETAFRRDLKQCGDAILIPR